VTQLPLVPERSKRSAQRILKIPLKNIRGVRDQCGTGVSRAANKKRVKKRMLSFTLMRAG
jgi:hypothetical protein